jgi:hypothetical protein
MRLSIPAFTVLLLGAPALAGSPFEGWTKEQVLKHREKAEVKLTQMLTPWCAARPKVVVTCSMCDGRGEIVEVVQLPQNNWQPREFRYPCDKCHTHGMVLNEDAFKKVGWYCFSPDCRKVAEFSSDFHGTLAAAKQDAAGALPYFATLSRSRRKSLDVYGNYAVATIEEERDSGVRTGRLELIQIDSVWWSAHPVHDKGFERFKYPEFAPEREPADVDAAESEPPTEKLPPPQAPPPIDAASALEAGDVSLKHVEDTAYRVTGQVRNTTADRRIALVEVTVSLFKGSRLAGECECSVGPQVVGPGESATFSGYLYSGAPPDFDRIETKVTRAQFLGD